MNTSEILSGAFAALETESAKSVISYASRLLPSDVALGLNLARSMARPMYDLIRSFIDGEIKEDQFKANWEAMVREGMVADALVQAAALQRRPTEG